MKNKFENNEIDEDKIEKARDLFRQLEAYRKESSFQKAARLILIHESLTQIS